MNTEKNTPSGSVVIVGGGVAGMAAARLLGRHRVRVHLVEKSETLGGNAANWACMATDTCRNCGACLSQELAASIPDLDQVTVHLNRTVTAIDKQGQTVQVTLDGCTDSPLTADRLILASGMTPIHPEGMLGQACGSHPRVITTDRLNRILSSGRLSSYLADTPSPRIAFLQCVGSRNRETGRDYCSQVCCRISLRHINKLLHLYPDAQITLFYMDLQIIGKEARAEFDALSDNVRLVQGVPAQILDPADAGGLTLIHDDPRTMARAALHADMIVLSVGIQPAGGVASLMTPAGPAPDRWGFFKSDDTVYVAGCAGGPKDILSAITEGENCAWQIMKNLGRTGGNPEKTAVAVIGDGRSSDRAAAAISALGYDTWVFGTGPRQEMSAAGINYVPESDILSVDGQVNQYTIRYAAGGNPFSLTAAAIVIALDPDRSTAGSHLTLSPERLHSLDDFSRILDSRPDSIPETLVFWLDHAGPEPKDSARELLILADRTACQGRRVWVLMNKMLVHGMDGQTRYDQARRNGVRFLRVRSPEDVAISETSDGLALVFEETTIRGGRLKLDTPWLIIPDRQFPHSLSAPTASLFREPLDSEGRLQSPNVRHRLTGSFRKGLFYTGAGRHDMDENDLAMEILHICAGICSLDREPETAVRINDKKCAKCLTCLRVCPHSAIRINNGVKPYIIPDACFSCGLCVANCPAHAIEKADSTDPLLIGRIRTGQTVVFACDRSAALAAAAVDLPDHVTVLPVSCTCRISRELVIKALLQGAEKIILAGCHDGNCRSDKGHAEARAVASAVNSIPGMTDPPRVIWQPVAANEGRAFLELTTQCSDMRLVN